MQTSTPLLDEYIALGMTPEQAREAISMCAALGVDAGQALVMLSQAMGQGARGISEFSGRAEDLNAKINRQPLSRPTPDEHRLRSMRKPTGKPWDARAR